MPGCQARLLRDVATQPCVRCGFWVGVLLGCACCEGGKPALLPWCRTGRSDELLLTLSSLWLACILLVMAGRVLPAWLWSKASGQRCQLIMQAGCYTLHRGGLHVHVAQVPLTCLAGRCQCTLARPDCRADRMRRAVWG